MKKAMFLLLLPFLAAAMFLLSSAPAESRTVQDIQSYVDAAKALNLSEGNLQVKSNEFDAEEILKDARFMGLLRGRIRIARLVDSIFAQTCPSSCLSADSRVMSGF